MDHSATGGPAIFTLGGWGNGARGWHPAKPRPGIGGHAWATISMLERGTTEHPVGYDRREHASIAARCDAKAGAINSEITAIETWEPCAVKPRELSEPAAIVSTGSLKLPRQ